MSHKAKLTRSQNVDYKLIKKYKAKNDGDSLIRLVNKYLPLIKSLWSQYYIRGMDFFDWKQESIEVMIKVVRFYDPERRVNFGAYYRKCLRNRLYDLIRRQNAKKRIPNERLTSYSAHESYYNDTLIDVKATHPDRSIVLAESLKQLLKKCSDFERKVMMGLIHRQPYQQIAKVNECQTQKVVNAFERCKLKFQRLRNNESN